MILFFPLSFSLCKTEMALYYAGPEAPKGLTDCILLAYKVGIPPQVTGALAAEEETQDVLVWHILSRVHLVGCSLPPFSCREKRQGIPGTRTPLVAWSSWNSLSIVCSNVANTYWLKTITDLYHLTIVWSGIKSGLNWEVPHLHTS